MESNHFFSRFLVTKANSKMPSARSDATSTLPTEVAAIIASGRKSTSEIKAAFKSASLRLRQG